jgi:hypothetical protein
MAVCGEGLGREYEHEGGVDPGYKRRVRGRRPQQRRCWRRSGVEPGSIQPVPGHPHGHERNLAGHSRAPGLPFFPGPQALGLAASVPGLLSRAFCPGPSARGTRRPGEPAINGERAPVRGKFTLSHVKQLSVIELAGRGSPPYWSPCHFVDRGNGGGVSGVGAYEQRCCHGSLTCAGPGVPSAGGVPSL